VPSISFRKIKPEEIAGCQAKFAEKYPWAGTPQWEGVYVYVEDGQVVGFVGFQFRVVVEPLYADSPRVTQALVERADTLLLSYKEYEFVVNDSNEKFQQLLENHYGLKGEVEPPHKVYFVRK